MNTVTATFFLPNEIVEGLANGIYERIGGVIREVGTKHVVAWLKEATSTINSTDLALSSESVTNLLNLIVAKVSPSLDDVQEIFQLTSAVSILNFGVSTMGFAVLNQRLNLIEENLKQAEELLKNIDSKIDIGYYANFKAALNLAVNAFTMSKQENRRSSALQAINRFLEAQHIYLDYTDRELEQGSQISDKYLLTVALAYLAEVRCYLELEEFNTALSRFQEGMQTIRSRVHQYIELLLTSNPAIYLHPQFTGKIDLRRLTRIYQWLDSTLDENAVFEMHRESIGKIIHDPDKWIATLPKAIWNPGIDWRGKKFWEDPKPHIYAYLPKVMLKLESMIETANRFEAYQTEVELLSQIDMSFQDWLQLAPRENKPQEAQLIFVLPDKP